VNDDASSPSASPADATLPRDRVTGRSRVSRWLYLAVGGVMFGFGALGLAVPGLPTTGFWLIAAFCFARSHPAACRWIYKRGHTGEMIRLMIEERSLTRSAKRRASAGIVLGIALSLVILYLTGTLSPLVLAGLLVSIPIALLVVWWCFRTLDRAG
jgi:uncharacterized membrane protein YbaN (DUF454 family)